MPNVIRLGSLEGISRNFLPEEPDSRESDPYRCMTPTPPDIRYRALHAHEIEVLVKNNNSAEDWAQIFVTDEFDPDLISNCDFYGRVLLGDLAPQYIEYHDLRLPVGIRNSTIVSCRIGDHVAIRDVHYLAHYVIGTNCILFNVDEMLCTNHAKFGNGILKEGEEEDVRIWLEVVNENDGRKILPFEGLITADAYLWSRHRDDAEFLSRLVAITDSGFSEKRGFYGEVGDRTVIKSCRIIKDVKIGSDAYIKGANKLKNITILSSAEESSQIGEGVELVNGIVGYGNRIFYEAKAIRFVTGRNVQLKYGARLLNSVLGDNSTVSCCELLNNLIFPFHEQHHNNSFLIASMVMGQSNIAAGATIGSNHNSRAPDGEIVAGRGFWPGLCSNFKHNSSFASFALVAKGSYSYELDIRYPFALVSMDKKEEAVHVMPAYWFVHNMYAMARNSWKFRKRDGRKVKEQNIEFDYLAPDTVQEMLAAMARLEILAAKAWGGTEGLGEPEQRRREKGRAILSGSRDDGSPLKDPQCMRRFGGIVEKPARGWREYRDFCAYFGVKTLVDFFGVVSGTGLSDFIDGVRKLAGTRNCEEWTNVGGQIMPSEDLEAIRRDIKAGTLASWGQIHARYNALWSDYPERKARYSIYAVETALRISLASLDESGWRNLIGSVAKTFETICDSAFASRRKDYEDSYRRMVYASDEEMYAVLGKIEDNSFLIELEKQTKAYTDILRSLIGA